MEKKIWKKRGTETTIDEVIQRNTGIDVAEFLNPPTSYTVMNLDKAAAMIRDAADHHEKITVYGDYDADGVTASVILYATIRAMGVTPDIVLPKRFSEGYGLSMKCVEEINSGLLITVDNGIVAIDQIARAKEKGLKVLVVDHHEPREDGVLPNADCIVNPHAIPGGDFDGYCGAGLAYKLAQELQVSVELEDKLVSFAAIGTVADVMPLIKDNRNIVVEGLKKINQGIMVPGLKKLLELMNLQHVSEGEIGFKIGPVINASGRMYDDGAKRVFDLLIGGQNYADRMAESLISTNQLRQASVKEGMIYCDRLIAERCLYGESPLILYTTKEDEKVFHEGVVGILAGKLAENFKVPTFVFTETESGILKGSGRSYGDINMKELCDAVSSTLIAYGGHAGAAGVSVEIDKVEDMKSAMAAYVAALPVTPEQADDTVLYDLEIKSDELAKTMQALNRFAPFGEGNPRPVFKVSDIHLSPSGGNLYRTMGEQSQHIKLFCDGFDCVGFDKTEEYKDAGEPTIIDVVASLSENFFADKVTLQLEMADFQRAASPAKTNLSNLLNEKLRKGGL